MSSGGTSQVPLPRDVPVGLYTLHVAVEYTDENVSPVLSRRVSVTEPGAVTIAAPTVNNGSSIRVDHAPGSTHSVPVMNNEDQAGHIYWLLTESGVSAPAGLAAFQNSNSPSSGSTGVSVDASAEIQVSVDTGIAVGSYTFYAVMVVGGTPSGIVSQPLVVRDPSVDVAEPVINSGDPVRFEKGAAGDLFGVLVTNNDSGGELFWLLRQDGLGAPSTRQGVQASPGTVENPAGSGTTAQVAPAGSDTELFIPRDVSGGSYKLYVILVVSGNESDIVSADVTVEEPSSGPSAPTVNNGTPVVAEEGVAHSVPVQNNEATDGEVYWLLQADGATAPVNLADVQVDPAADDAGSNDNVDGSGASGLPVGASGTETILFDAGIPAGSYTLYVVMVSNGNSSGVVSASRYGEPFDCASCSHDYCFERYFVWG